MGSSWGRQPFQAAQVRVEGQCVKYFVRVPCTRPKGCTNWLNAATESAIDWMPPAARGVRRGNTIDSDGAPATFKLARLQWAYGAIVGGPGLDGQAARPHGEGPDRVEGGEGGHRRAAVPSRAGGAQVVDHSAPDGRRAVGGRRHAVRPPRRTRAQPLLAHRRSARRKGREDRQSSAKSAGHQHLVTTPKKPTSR